MLQFIKKKQIELNGLQPKSVEEQIQDIADPNLRQKFTSLENKYRELKNEIDTVNSSSEKFDKFLSKMRRGSFRLTLDEFGQVRERTGTTPKANQASISNTPQVQT